MQISHQARAEAVYDSIAGLREDPGPEAATEAGLQWLLRAQLKSRSQDGGVSRHFSLIDGWTDSYPETTGYIVPTLIEISRRRRESHYAEIGRRMTDWLLTLQRPDGGFPGGTVREHPQVPVTFNTGQILFGLASAVGYFGDRYREPMARAADWLARTSDADGAWRRFASPFTAPGDKVYETHVAWALLVAAKVSGKDAWAEVAIKNVEWALTKQRANGWFSDCCLEDPSAPLTHTIGYALRGVIEAYRYALRPEFLEAALRTADSLVRVMRADGYLPGRLDASWQPTVRWVCLTGTAQIAHCLLLLFRETGEQSFRDAARSALTYVRRTVLVSGHPDRVGGIKGSFPVYGAYGRYEYLNWGVKFFIDAQLCELDIDAGHGGQN